MGWVEHLHCKNGCHPSPLQKLENSAAHNEFATTTLQIDCGEGNRTSSLLDIFGSPCQVPPYLKEVPATNYSINPSHWDELLNSFNDDAVISQSSNLLLPIGAKIVEYKRSTISSKNQLPRDVPIEKHTWIRIRDRQEEKTLPTIQRFFNLDCSMSTTFALIHPTQSFLLITISAAADAFATSDTMGIGGWVSIYS